MATLPTAGQRRTITAALFVAMVLAGLDSAVVTTAMPTVVGQLGGIDLYAWVFSAYLLSSTVSVPLYGKLADLTGRKRVFLGATLLFLVGSALCGQSRSMQQLIAFRLLQGLGAGGVIPTAFTIAGDIYPLEERARLSGWFSAAWGLSALVGPAIGGFLTQQVSWRWAFYVNLPLGLLAIALVARGLREQVHGRASALDVRGAALLTAGVAALLVAMLLVGDGDVPHALALAPVVLAALAAFVWWERRAAEPLLPMPLLRRRIMAVGSAHSLLLGVVLYGQAAFVPPYIQGVMGASPTVAGLVLSCTSIGWPVASTVGGRVMIRWGYRALAVVGGLTLLAGVALLRLMGHGGGLLGAAGIQVVIGAGFGFLSPVSLLAMQNAVPWDRRGVATSLNQFTRTIGGTVGVALAGALFAAGVGAGRLGSSGDPNALLDQVSRAALAPGRLQALQQLLGSSLELVFGLFAVVAALTTAAGALLPGGAAEEHSEEREGAGLEPGSAGER